MRFPRAARPATIGQNRYSVPVALAGLTVSARVGAREITICHGGREVARHERLHGKYATSALLDHYLELLARKPGGLEHSLALRQERDRGKWPERFDELWTAPRGRYGRSEAARQIVDVLLLCREHDPAVASWRSAARWRRARSTAARLRCSPVANSGPPISRWRCPSGWNGSSGPPRASGSTTS